MRPRSKRGTRRFALPFRSRGDSLHRRCLRHCWHGYPGRAFRFLVVRQGEVAMSMPYSFCETDTGSRVSRINRASASAVSGCASCATRSSHPLSIRETASAAPWHSCWRHSGARLLRPCAWPRDRAWRRFGFSATSTGIKSMRSRTCAVPLAFPRSKGAADGCGLDGSCRIIENTVRLRLSILSGAGPAESATGRKGRRDAGPFFRVKLRPTFHTFFT